MASNSASQFRLIAVDLDGTLLNHAGEPHPRDLKALRAAASQGVIVTIVTGRLYSGARAAAQAIGITGPLACAEGSHLVRGSDHSTLGHHGLSEPVTLGLRAAIELHRPEATFLFAADGIFHDAAGAPHLGYVRTWSTEARPTPAILEHSLWAEREALTGVVSIGSREQLEGIRDSLVNTFGNAVQVATFALRHPPGAWGMFVRAAHVNKGTALAFIAEHHAIPLEHTICVGDWINDVAMFRVAGRSYAMAQAPDEVKRLATGVLLESSAEGGGIARVIEENFGIRVD